MFTKSKDVSSAITYLDKRVKFIHDERANQKYGELPYSFHLECTASLALNAMLGTDISNDEALAVLFAAYMHDSIEDARLTYNDVHAEAVKFALLYMVNEEYADLATEIVYACTSEKGRNRSERENDKYYEGIVNTKHASLVKLCDRCANMMFSFMTHSSMFGKYSQELPHFLEGIHEKNHDYSDLMRILAAINTKK